MIMMEQTNMIVFEKKQTKQLLNDLEIKTINIRDKEFVLNDNGEIATCPECQTEISIENVGNIAHGSKIVFCDNPACFSKHLAKQKL